MKPFTKWERGYVIGYVSGALSITAVYIITSFLIVGC